MLGGICCICCGCCPVNIPVGIGGAGQGCCGPAIGAGDGPWYVAMDDGVAEFILPTAPAPFALALLSRCIMNQKMPPKSRASPTTPTLTPMPICAPELSPPPPESSLSVSSRSVGPGPLGVVVAPASLSPGVSGCVSRIDRSLDAQRIWIMS